MLFIFVALVAISFARLHLTFSFETWYYLTWPSSENFVVWRWFVFFNSNLENSSSENKTREHLRAIVFHNFRQDKSASMKLFLHTGRKHQPTPLWKTGKTSSRMADVRFLMNSVKVFNNQFLSGEYRWYTWTDKARPSCGIPWDWGLFWL